MTKRPILVVDDTASTRTYLSDLLSSHGYTVDSLPSGEQAVGRLASGYSPAVILLDILMPGMDGLEVLTSVKKSHPAIPVIVLSSQGQTKTVVEAMKMGASDYLVKPFEEEELQLAIENALEKQRLREEVKNLRQQLDQYAEYADILSTSPRVLRIREIARQVADADVPVLLLGESGVGKEVVARFIHAQSARRDKQFIKLNCAAVPHDLLESELFGYERGAFTGALSEKPGKFELAGKGCILLDEIGDMSLQLQAKLLHVLQDGEYCRLGGKRSSRVEARILASTNKRIDEAIAKGEFREDLFFRLNVIRIEIPPLRERREDIPLLCNYFLQKYRDRYKSSLQQLPAELLDACLRYNWPGNVRQLENTVKRYLILPDLEAALAELKAPGSPAEVPSKDPRTLHKVSAQAAEQAERELVLRTLEETNWNRKQAAVRLGICYKALLNRIKKWQIESRSKNDWPAAKRL